MFDWRVCVIFWFRVRGYLSPCRFSRRVLLWRNELRIRKVCHGGADYLRNASLGP
jgi:hypothetical protein